MFYQGQLQLLCETFKKCHLTVEFIGIEDTVEQLADKTFKLLFGNKIDLQLSFKDFIGNAEHNTIYKMSTPFQLNYAFLLLPDSAQDTLFIMGPYLTSLLTDENLLEIGELYNISPQRQRLLKDYYAHIPIVTNDSPLFVMLESFGEYIWGARDFSIIDINTHSPSDISSIDINEIPDDLNDVLINMNIMERRYSFENELIQAVSQGQIHKIEILMSAFKSMPFEKRLSDQIRNLKNYCIIMNTILRKAAEQGGVHPLYLDSLSSEFAHKIEQINSVEDIYSLMNNMFHSYCKLVQKNSMKNYSSVVQKAIVCINSDLAGNLSLSNLAKIQNVSAGYLSTIFKKETGKTITDYINSRRVRLASQLLATTKLQVQTIALHCGILDVHYFSKIFKKYTGKTPKEYRESTR